MSKRIVHLTTVHPPNDVRIYFKECKSLAQAGYDVWLVASKRGEPDQANVNYKFLPSASNRFQRMLFLPVMAFFAALKLRADLYHFHDPELIPVGVLLKMCGKKVVYDAHENVAAQTLYKDWINKRVRKIVAKITGFVEHNAAKCFNAVVTATPSIRDSFSGKVSSVIDINNFPLLSEAAVATQERKHIVYVGSISVMRGINEMVAAVKKINQTLVLAGPLNRCVDKEKILTDSCVDYRGILSRTELLALLPTAAVGLVLFHPAPNHTDAMPNKLFEYMQQGIPVIASNFPLWREILDDQECGLCVDPLDVEQIANAIQYLLDHPDEARKMGENGSRLVKTKYNWGSESEKLISLYRTLLES